MNTKSNVVIGKEAIERMTSGIKVATDVIRMTYGPKGCNTIVESEFYPFHGIYNDAQTIVQAIQVEGVVEKRGLNLFKELMDRANKYSKDGRKTTGIIAESILTKGLEIECDYNQLKRDLDALIPVIEQKLDAQKRIITLEKVHKVASIAAESEERGRLIGEIYEKVGKDGIIDVEGSGTYYTSYNFTDGVRFEGAGFLSPAMVHDESLEKQSKTATKAVYENPVILVTKKKISHINEINPLLLRLEKEGKKDLVIFTDDMDSGVASVMVNAHKSKVINILIIKAPVLWKNYVFEDFAKVTGSTIVEDATGINFKNLQISHLGTCAKIVTDKDETVIVGGADITDHINGIKSNGDQDSLIRLRWLTSKTAVLKIGANSESELSYYRLKAEDGINASRLALIDGAVLGGGLALESVAKELPDTLAGNILRFALSEPRRQILKNGSIESSNQDDILDAVKVVKNAVRNAIGLVSTVLTAPIDIALPTKTPEQIAHDMLKNKGMRF